MGSTKLRTLALCLLAVGLVGGCGSKSEFEFDSLDLAPPQEELSEFKLGDYSIPIPVAGGRGSKELGRRNRLQLDFELFALVRPDQQSLVADDWARHEGKIRDNVIQVCRKASVQDLQEPELSTLKARLMDALSAQMGKDELRQLLITEVVSEEL